MKRQVGCSSVHLEKSSRRKASFCSAVVEKMLPSSDQAGHTTASTLTRTPDVFFFLFKKKMNQKMLMTARAKIVWLFFCCHCWFLLFFSLSMNDHCTHPSGEILSAHESPEGSRGPAQQSQNPLNSGWTAPIIHTSISWTNLKDAASPPPASPFFDRLRETVMKSRRWIPELHHSIERNIYFFFYTRPKINVECIAALLSKSRSNETNAEAKKTAHCSFSNVCK